MPRQFVVQVTNQPGQMARLAEEMAAAGVDLRAIGGGGLGEVGHFIMTTADDDGARKVLDDGGWTFLEGESLLAEVDDRPGGMAVSRRLLVVRFAAARDRCLACSASCRSLVDRSSVRA